MKKVHLLIVILVLMSLFAGCTDDKDIVSTEINSSSCENENDETVLLDERDDSALPEIYNGYIFSAVIENGEVGYLDFYYDIFEEWGIDKDSYIYKFITNQYAVEFDEETYMEKVKEQLPEDSIFIYDSELYVEGTLEDMMLQYGECFDYDLEVDAGIDFFVNSAGEKGIILFLSHYNKGGAFCLQMCLVEKYDGLEVVYMRDYNPYIRFCVYNDGFLYTKDELAGNTDLYFTCVDRAGDFILVSHAYYESNNIDVGSFEDECRHYVEQQGIDYDKLIEEQIGGSAYEKEIEVYLMVYK